MAAGESAVLDAHAVWRVLVDALDPRADAELIDREDWVQLRTPSSPYPNHNKILRARLRSDEVDARIEAVLREHAERGAGLQWVVDADSQPADLSQRLCAAGLPVEGSGLGMVRAVPAPPLPAPPPGVRIVQATVDDCERLGDIAIRGWGKSAGFGRVARQSAERAFAGKAGDVAFWLAYEGDALVGSSTLRVLPSSSSGPASLGYLQGGCVIPQARGRGIYRALTWVRLEALHRRGIEHVVIWADPKTSGPIAERMGFEVVTRAQFHARDAPESSA